MPNEERPLYPGLDAYLEERLAEDLSWRALCGESDTRSGPDGSHTPREILQQPWVWSESGRIVSGNLPGLSSLFAEVSHIVLTGAGSSFYVGKCVEAFLTEQLERPVQAVPTTDLILEAGTWLGHRGKGLVVSFSRSGGSPESLEAFRTVSDRHPDYSQLLITCNRESKLLDRFQQKSNCTAWILHPASCDKGLAMTSSFTSMIVAAQALGFPGRPGAYTEHIKALSAGGKWLLSQAAKVTAAVGAQPVKRACFLGTGALGGVAQEGALKVLEMTDGRIGTLSESFLGVRHGPLSFVDAETLVVYLISSQPLKRRYESDLMQEIWTKRLGRMRFGLGRGLSAVRGFVEEAIDFDTGFGDPVPDLLRPPLDILLCQVLALRFSLALGLDPDNPSRSGAISRVVQGVKIHEQ